jgi:hypothetical protein
MLERIWQFIIDKWHALTIEGIWQFIIDKWHALTIEAILLWLLTFGLTFVLSIGLIILVLVKIPANYFSSHYQSDFLPNTQWYLRWSALILKNLLGLFLIALGIVLSIPGVPGQGFLTILLGLIMLDIPGKRPLEARIIGRPTVLAAANKIRSRYGKPPLQLD